MNEKKRVLIMDDEDMIRRLCHRLLGQDYEVVTVSGRFEAFNAFSDARVHGKPFDLVILDLEGREDPREGIRAIQDLIRVDSHVKAVLHSSRVVQFTEADLRAEGFIGGIQKGRPTRELLDAIASFLC